MGNTLCVQIMCSGNGKFARKEGVEDLNSPAPEQD